MGKNKKKWKKMNSTVVTKPQTEYTRKYEGKTLLFCYGTLNLHSVQEYLWGESKSGTVAALPDYELRSYENNIFYLVKKFGESVAGKVYELTDEQLAATDGYEGKYYKKEQVKLSDKVVYVYVQNKEAFNEVSETDTKVA